MMAKQINPYFSEINAKEFQNFTNIMISSNLVD